MRYWTTLFVLVVNFLEARCPLLFSGWSGHLFADVSKSDQDISVLSTVTRNNNEELDGSVNKRDLTIHESSHTISYIQID